MAICDKFCRKNFWKFAAGFIGIIALAVGALFVFRYWQNYKEEQELKTLLKEAREQQKEKPLIENPAENSVPNSP